MLIFNKKDKMKQICKVRVSFLDEKKESLEGYALKTSLAHTMDLFFPLVLNPDDGNIKHINKYLISEIDYLESCDDGQN